MVISRTPLRMSLVGGGSDLVPFAAEHGGAVLTTTIDKYIYVIVNERFEDDIRVSYSKTEIVPSVDELQHELVREALRTTGLPRKLEIVTIADVPSEGTGLGSSSAVTVGTLNALFAYQGVLKSARELASEACRIEIDVLGKPIGRQDQYATAIGGLQLLRFGPGDAVTSDPVVLTYEQRRTLGRNLLLFYTGRQRSATAVLHSIDPSDKDVAGELAALRDDALELYEELGRSDGIDVVGDFLDRNWQRKRRLSSVTTPEIDGWYEAARDAGALGGKLLGAGGGGFLLFYVPAERQAAVRAALRDLRELPFELESRGSRIIQVGR
jgi:D-glycero-alpha-D-manno-heptose-7-phosphate kinase